MLNLNKSLFYMKMLAHICNVNATEHIQSTQPCKIGKGYIFSFLLEAKT